MGMHPAVKFTVLVLVRAHLRSLMHASVAAVLMQHMHSAVG
jgi:hypothetical protein